MTGIIQAVRSRPADTDNPLGKFLFDDRTRVWATIITFITMMAGLGLSAWGSNPAFGNILYGAAYLAGGFYGLHATIASLMDRKLDIDLLMILAAVGAAIVGAPFEGAMLLFLFSLSNVLQDYALNRTSNAIRALMDLRPEEAMVSREGDWVNLPVEEIRVGDRLAVRPGERIPLDGAILEGRTSVDQSPITGESIPVEKKPGDTVLAGTINQNGSIELRVSLLAQDSTLSRLINLVAEAQSEKAQTQRFIDQAEQYYAWAVIAITTLAIAIPVMFLAEHFDAAFYRGMTLLVAASPCAVVISTPATVLSAVGNAARRGVLFKGGVYVERAASLKVFAFDKTGTLTIGKPALTDIVVLDRSNFSGTEADLLCLAASAEQRSEHPLARAIVRAARDRDLPLKEADHFQSFPGKGIKARVDGMWIGIGNARFNRDINGNALPGIAQQTLAIFNSQGKTSVLIAIDDRVVGIVALADQLRPNILRIMAALKKQGVEKTVMLTGDHDRIGKYIAEQAGLDDYYADLLPEQKLQIIKRLEKEYGPVAMVGDGVNDAPALAAASIGIAMGAAGTDVALETADIVLMGDDLSHIPYLFDLSRKTRKTLIQNLVFAFAVIIVLIGATLGLELALPLSVIGHEGSTVLVSLNGIRLLGYRGE